MHAAPSAALALGIPSRGAHSGERASLAASAPRVNASGSRDRVEAGGDRIM
jgi:hypothetical protein